MQDKGFPGFPALVFMDAQGNVLASPSSRTVTSFGSTLSLVETYLAVKKKADGGDDTVVAELLLAELTLGKVGLEEAKERFLATEDLSPTQTSRIEKEILALEMRDVLVSANNLIAAASGL